MPSLASIEKSFPSIVNFVTTRIGNIAWRIAHVDRTWKLSRVAIETHQAWFDERNVAADCCDFAGDELNNDLSDRLRAWSEGEQVCFADVPIACAEFSDFRQHVTECCRQIPWGQTVTYGELARRAGRPGAARAVGRVMASNPLPIVVPCHRVLASNGQLGGFSAPGGLVTKQRFLDLERVVVA